MLLNLRELDGIAEGRITVVFRRWKRAGVKAGTQQRTRIGVVAVKSVEVVEAGNLTDVDARSAGHVDLTALRAWLDKYGDGEVHRVELFLAGPDPRVALREQSDLSQEDAATIHARLSGMDGRSSFGPWTVRYLRMIAAQPAVRAPDLAESVGRETRPFKIDVRKLKELGLTESLAVGYRLSPRGQAFLDYLDARS